MHIGVALGAASFDVGCLLPSFRRQAPDVDVVVTALPRAGEPAASAGAPSPDLLLTLSSRVPGMYPRAWRVGTTVTAGRPAAVRAAAGAQTSRWEAQREDVSVLRALHRSDVVGAVDEMMVAAELAGGVLRVAEGDGRHRATWWLHGRYMPTEPCNELVRHLTDASRSGILAFSPVRRIPPLAPRMLVA